MENVIIIGSGPAGHTAAIYLSRANLKPLMLEGSSNGEIFPGGLLTKTNIVENFPGFPKGIDGFELTERFKAQSLNFGTVIKPETVVKINKIDQNYEVETDTKTYMTRSILIATGSTPNRLYIPGYDEFWHKGVSTCAVCDGGLPQYRNVDLAVVGGGDSACEEALHLSHTASKVYLIHRRDKLRASKIMTDRVLKNNKIEIIWNSEVLEIGGSSSVDFIRLSGERIVNVKGVFIAIGHKPNSGFVKDIVDLDQNGYIITDKKLRTSCKGIWAAGDVQDPYYRQAITASGSGCIAALEIERYLE